MNRLRELAQRPLDPSTARAVLVLGCAVTVALGVVVVVGILSPGGGADPRPLRVSVGGGTVRSSAGPPSVSEDRSRPRRDPLDEPGSPARRRAEHEISVHRALQHLPWHHRGVRVSLVGAHGGRAVLEVDAPDPGAARRGYRAVLARYHDDGAAYLVRLRITRGSR